MKQYYPIVIIFLLAISIGWLIIYTIPEKKDPPSTSGTDTSGGGNPVDTIQSSIWTDSDGWTHSRIWPYGKWKGGIKEGKPDGGDITVIYTVERVFDENDLTEQKSVKGDSVVGDFSNGNLLNGFGTIYHPDGSVEKFDSVWTDFDGWTHSRIWHYGKWKGGIKEGKPDGVGITIIYTAGRVFDENDLMEQKSVKGDKVVGDFSNGNLLNGFGTIYHPDGSVERFE